MAAELNTRIDRFISEMKWSVKQITEDPSDNGPALTALLTESYKERSAALKRKDTRAFNNPDWYKNARLQNAFAEGTFHSASFKLPVTAASGEALLKTIRAFLALANEGTDLIILEGADKAFTNKAIGFVDVQKTHEFVRLLRMVTEIVCNSVLLTVAPKNGQEDLSGWYGSIEKPEVHLNLDQAFLPYVYHTFASLDTRLLTSEVNRLNTRPGYLMLARSVNNAGNIFWNLDYEYLKWIHTEEEPHRAYLNQFFTGKFEGSYASGKLVHDKISGEIGVKGTMDTLLGMEKAKTESARSDAADRELIVYALMLSLGGLPIIPAAQEVPSPAVTRLQKAVKKFVQLRKKHTVFDNDADVWTMNVDNTAALVLGRYKEGEKFYAVFNFSAQEQIITLRDPGTYTNLITDKTTEIHSLIRLEPYAVKWLKETK